MKVAEGVRHLSFYHKDTGILHSKRFMTSQSRDVEANTPADHVAIDGWWDCAGQRVDVATGPGRGLSAARALERSWMERRGEMLAAKDASSSAPGCSSPCSAAYRGARNRRYSRAARAGVGAGRRRGPPQIDRRGDRRAALESVNGARRRALYPRRADIGAYTLPRPALDRIIAASDRSLGSAR
jgi:hypothetical protein